MYRADAHFRMGTSHEAEGSCCQDYALAENGRLPFAVVSDGCSTSGRTDIGARLWCLAARDTLSWSFTLDPPRIRALQFRDTVGVDIEDMDATLGFVKANEDGSMTTLLAGDGVMAARTPTETEIVVVEWAGNMPGYPSYHGERKRLFIEQSTALAKLPYRFTRFAVPDGSHTGVVVDGGECSAEQGLKGISVKWAAHTEIAAVMSDGVGQVSGLDLQTVVTELLAFGPAREGAFARRRLNGALKRWAKDGHRPVDDISIAALVKVDV